MTSSDKAFAIVMTGIGWGIVLLCTLLFVAIPKPEARSFDGEYGPRVTRNLCTPEMEIKTGAIVDLSYKDEQPSVWFLNVCDDRNICGVLQIPHAPWPWQKEGAKVRMIWDKKCDNNFYPGYHWFELRIEKMELGR